MLSGILVKLVHLSQQPCVFNARLVPGHNDTGYGVIQDANGGEVYFSHEAVAHRHGFNLLQEGQRLDYTMEDGPFLRAVNVYNPAHPT